MISTRLIANACLAAALIVSVQHTSQAEVLEEIVAWVNGDIITKSEYEEEEQTRLAEGYRRFSGEELDAFVEEMRTGLLLEMIDRKILVHHAQALGYNTQTMGDAFYESFREQQGITDDAEFAQLLEDEGLTEAALKQRLIETYAPEEVIRFEVSSRVAVSELEIQAYYEKNPQMFEIEGEVTFREIVIRAGTDAEKDQRRPLAEEVLLRVSSGEDFAEVALEVSEAGTKDSGGLIGPIKRVDLRDELAEFTFAIPVGEISDVIEMPYGFHLLKIESREDATIKTIDEVRDQLRTFLEQLKYRDQFSEFMGKARSNSEWCVKPKYQNLIAVEAPTRCETL